MNQNKILEFEIRRRIYNFISKKPGLYERDISRQMQIPKTTLRYHLKYMVKQNLITLKKFEGYNRYFISQKISQREKEILNILRKETPRRIILCLLACSVCSQIELSKKLERPPKSIEFHLKKLLDLGIIEQYNKYVKDGILLDSRIPSILKRKRIGCEKLYGLKNVDALQTIHRLLLYYNGSLDDRLLIKDWLEQFKDEFNALIKRKAPLKERNTIDGGIDFITEFCNETFPLHFRA